MSRFFARLLFGSALFAAACGGSEEKGLYGGTGGATSSGGSGGGMAGSGGSVAGGASGASGSGGSVVSGGSSGTDAGTDATTDGAVGQVGGSGGATGGVGGGGASGAGMGPCGAVTCTFSAGDACCKGDGLGLYCSNDKLSNPCKCTGIACGTLEIFCDGPEDCPTGQVCCAERGLISGSWDVVKCRGECKSDQPVGSTRREVCHAAGPPCANGSACKADPGLPAGYSTCQL